MSSTGVHKSAVKNEFEYFKSKIRDFESEFYNNKTTPFKKLVFNPAFVKVAASIAFVFVRFKRAYVNKFELTNKSFHKIKITTKFETSNLTAIDH